MKLTEAQRVSANVDINERTFHMQKLITATLLGGAIVAAPLLLGTGTASASCASLNGHGIGNGCTSTVGSASVGLGRDAQADSAGPGSVAVAVGNPGFNRFYGTNLPTQAYANGTGNGSFAFGDGSIAGTLGTGNHAFVLGQGSNAYSYGGSNVPAPNKISDYLPSHSNTSVTLGDRSEAGAVDDCHSDVRIRSNRPGPSRTEGRLEIDDI